LRSLVLCIDEPANAHQSVAWIKAADCPSDVSIYQQGRTIYTQPRRVDGGADPFAGRRWGKLPGAALVTPPAPATVASSASPSASSAASSSPRVRRKALPNFTVNDPALLAVAIPAIFEGKVHHLGANSRHVACRIAARKFQARAFGANVCKLALAAWHLPSDESEIAFADALAALNVPGAAEIALRVRKLGAVLVQTRSTKPLGAREISRVVDNIYRHTGPNDDEFGSVDMTNHIEELAETPVDDGADFAAVDDEDDSPVADEGDDDKADDPLDSLQIAAMMSVGVDEAKARIRNGVLFEDVSTDVIETREVLLDAAAAGSEKAADALRKLLAKAGAPAKAKSGQIKQITLAEAIESASSFRNAYVVKGLLDLDAVNLLYAATNVGKTFAAVHISGCVAGGQKCFGRRVKQGPVVYLAAEGLAGIKRRFAAMSKRLDLPTDAPITIVPQAVNVLDKDGGKAFADVCRAARPVLIVVDTVHVATGGLEENNETFGKLVVYCKALIELTGAAVLLIHHEGKNSAAGSRGGSALISDVDNAFRLSRDETQPGRLHLSGAKLKEESKDGFGIALSLKRVVLGTDEDGDEVSTCVVDEAGDTGEAFAAVATSRGTANAMAVLRAVEALTGGDRKRTVTTGAIETRLVDLGRDKVKRGLASAEEVGLVVKSGRGEWRLAESEAHDLPDDEYMQPMGCYNRWAVRRPNYPFGRGHRPNYWAAFGRFWAAGNARFC
jgi:hypothetical protein